MSATPNKSIVFHFHVHQPRRLRKLQFFHIGAHDDYFDDRINERMVARAAREYYLPINKILLELINAHPNVKLCFSISGLALDQFEKYAPEVIDSFRALADTGSVEFLAETNYHSLASYISEEEFQAQILEHTHKIHQHFGLRPTIFRNTELIYDDAIGTMASHLGFSGVICNSADRLVNSGSEYQVYQHPKETDLRIFLRSNRLTQDIRRFVEGKSKLTVDDCCNLLYGVPDDDAVIFLGLDYEVFSDIESRVSENSELLKQLIERISNDRVLRIVTPSDVILTHKPFHSLSVKETISESIDQDLSSWLGNDMQTEAIEAIKELEPMVKHSGNSEFTDIWRYLQMSDHFYYMSTKTYADKSNSHYFSHYASPFEAFVNYMNIMSDFRLLLEESPVQPDLAEQARSLEYERQHTSPPVWALHHQSQYKQSS